MAAAHAWFVALFGIDGVPMEIEAHVDASRTTPRSTDWPDGLTAAKDFLPDMIFLDVIMPDVDGGEVAAQIRAEAKLKDTPIVFLTAGVSKEATRTRGDVIGGRTFLAKPVTVEEVIRCIEKQLGKRSGVGPGSSAASA